MSHIYLISPSSAVRDTAAYKRGLAVLKKLGHEVEVDEAARASHMRFAGDDDTRLAAISRAADSGADVVLTTRGGYGLTRLLPRLPYKPIAKSIAKGTQWVGLSDFTALQLATFAQTGAVTWQGPALGEDFGFVDEKTGEPDDIMLACFDDLLQGVGEGTGWMLSKAEALPEGKTLHIKNAILWGGNLTVLTSLLGTPYFPQAAQTKGGVLFIEDVGEHPYRIERMLTQLLHAGVLGAQKAIVFGQFTHYKLVPGHDKGFKLDTVVQWLRSQVKCPVLTSLPFGHVPTKVCLPVGRATDLCVQERETLLIWGDD
jgi:muramoyltetrapeptide carboxypeptidase